MLWAILTAVGIVFIASTHGCHHEQAGERAMVKTPNRRETPTLSLNEILDLDDRYTFDTVRSITTIQGSTKWRADQRYMGLKVYAGHVVYSVDENQELAGSLCGDFYVAIEEDIADVNDCENDISTLIQKSKCLGCTLTQPEKIIFIRDAHEARLAYSINMKDETLIKPSSLNVIVDACEESTIYLQSEGIMETSMPAMPRAEDTQREGLTSRSLNTSARTERGACPVAAFGTGGNLKIGDIVYGSEPYCLNVMKVGSICTLESANVKVVDLHQTTNKPGVVYSYDCVTPDDEIHGGKSANLDAFFYGEIINNVFEEHYNRKPLTFQILFYTHYGIGVDGAFFDGFSMTFGDGNIYYYPLVTLDIAAHEVGHGYTYQNSGLSSGGESGGIKEAFCDITGEAVKFHAPHLSGNNDWRIGYDAILDPNGALRYLDNPPLDGISIDHFSNYYSGMDVYFSCGLYNKAFYELVVTQGVGMKLAYGILLDTNKEYWSQTTGFEQGACDMKNAASDKGLKLTKIDNAFAVVGIDTVCCPISMDTLNDGTIILSTVSEMINPCYALLPFSSQQKKVLIKVKNNIEITIFRGPCMTLVTTKTSSLLYKLQDGQTDDIVCFSSGSEVNGASVEVKYIKKDKKKKKKKKKEKKNKSSSNESD